MPTLEVAARMVEQTPGITRLMDRLEAKGLVRRERCPVDRRQHLCWVTPAGVELLARLEGPTEAVAAETLRNVPATQRATIMRALDAIRDSGGA
jgi:DNA-binding MarR family transcriptional regulator